MGWKARGTDLQVLAFRLGKQRSCRVNAGGPASRDSSFQVFLNRHVAISLTNCTRLFYSDETLAQGGKPWRNPYCKKKMATYQRSFLTDRKRGTARRMQPGPRSRK